MDSIPRCILLVILILVGGVFSAAETAYSYCNRTRMKTLAADGDKASGRVCRILDNYDRTIVTLLIVINIIHITAAAVSAVLFASWMGEVGAVISTVVLTILMFVFSETIPKNIARANSDSLSVALSVPVLVLSYILVPLSTIFTLLGKGIKKIFGRGKKQPSITEDEFSEIITEVVENTEGVLEPEEGKIIQSAIEFTDITVKEVMTDIDKVVGISKNASLEKIKNCVLSCNYSRIPIYDGSPENIVGILRANEFLESLLKKGKKKDIKSFITPPYRIKEGTLIYSVFEEMTKRRRHMSVVIDDDGKTIGVVTMDDILSEIIGFEDETEGGESDE